jgi:hypothetical protein
MAGVRARILAELRPVIEQLLPGDVTSAGLVEWELVVAFVTGHSERMLALLDRYQKVSDASPSTVNLLAGRLLFHCLRPRFRNLSLARPRNSADGGMRFGHSRAHAGRRFVSVHSICRPTFSSN